MIATLYDKGHSIVAEHLIKTFSDGELEENSVCRKYRIVQDRLFQADFDKFAKGLLEEVFEEDE